MHQIYLDHLSTTPCDPNVAEAMWPWMTTSYGNPSSVIHSRGKKAAEQLERSRLAVAGHLHASPDEIIFTSGATESLNLAIRGLAEHPENRKKHIITCATEHSAVKSTLEALVLKGYSVEVLPADANGLLNLNHLEHSLRSDTLMVVVMHANNETGVMQDVKAIGGICELWKVPFICDTTQTIGKSDIQPRELGMDICCFSAHKFYGPTGIGGLYIRRNGEKNISIQPQMTGGGQENGLRSGTHHLAGIVGMAKALELAGEKYEEEHLRLSQLGERLEDELLLLGDVIVNGRQVKRIPGVVSASFRFMEGAALLAALNEKLCVSSGSACGTSAGKPSHVLKAMGLGDQQAMATVRFSIGRFTTSEDVDQAMEHIRQTVNQQRKESATWDLYANRGLTPVSSWVHPLG